MSNDFNEKIPVLDLEQFKNYFLDNEFNENMFTSNGRINPNYNSCKKTGTIAKIFEDNWDEFYKENKDLIDKYRPNAYDEIKKMCDCHNKNLGCPVYQCPNCGDFIFVGNTCKSRSCTSCGYKYKLERVEAILDTAYNCKHRQIVFTIPKEFRKYLFYPLNRIDIIYEAVNLTIYSILNTSYKKKKNKKRKKAYKSLQKFLPGFFAFLHTFGRDLKFNPHIHILIAEMKISDIEIKKWEYFNYDAHEDDSYHEVTVTASQFILLLLRHIVPKNYKTIRYYGFYRKKPIQHNKIKKLIDDIKIPFRKQFLNFEISIQKFFNRNPLYCPHCDVKMNYVVLIT